MAKLLPVKKIYVDSRFKTKDSKSHTDFYYDLKNSYEMPQNTSFYIDDVNIPNSWYSIENGVNSRMYLRYLDTENHYNDVIISLPSKIYDGDNFVVALNILLAIDAVSYPGGNKVQYFTSVYDSTKNLLNINSTNCNYYKIFSNDELKSENLNWTGPAYNHDDPCSLNEVIKNYGDTPVYNHAQLNFVSGFLDFSHYNNIYMSSSIGSYQTLSPNKDTTVVRKIPVNVPNGLVINDRQVSQHDTLDCSRQILSVPNFRFHDAYGKTINLNGCHVSFSIVFTSIREDM